MDLIELYNEKFAHFSDKGNVHTYIQKYYSEEFFMPQRIKNVLEIGVMSGGSLMMWHDWFPSANIVGLDLDENALFEFNKNCGDDDYDRAQVRITDAYTQESLDSFKDNHFDYIIDDGPHSLESQQYAVKHYLCKVRPGGKLIIEDVQQISWLKELMDVADPELVASHKEVVLDIKRRSDDIILEITRK